MDLDPILTGEQRKSSTVRLLPVTPSGIAFLSFHSSRSINAAGRVLNSPWFPERAAVSESHLVPNPHPHSTSSTTRSVEGKVNIPWCLEPSVMRIVADREALRLASKIGTAP